MELVLVVIYIASGIWAVRFLFADRVGKIAPILWLAGALVGAVVFLPFALLKQAARAVRWLFVGRV